MPAKVQYVPSISTVLMALLGLCTAQSIIYAALRFAHRPPSLLTGLSIVTSSHGQPVATDSQSCDVMTDVSLDWYPPDQWPINDLDIVIGGSGTFGFIFNSSQGPADTYNWCNMPHVNPSTYPKVDPEYQLKYVEVIHRHHKRTPYEANTFPVEGYAWDCDDEGLFFGGRPINPYGNGSAATYWSVYESPSGPFAPLGFNGTCQFPQITRGGLDDSFQHGRDLKAVYSGLLGFMPANYDPEVVSYRVTSNVITSQVASMVIGGMWPERRNVDTPLRIQHRSIDSLEPNYRCPRAGRLRDSYGPGSTSPRWNRHINAAAPLKARLDAISGVDPADRDWSTSYDHYFDNLSSRLCHDKPLPCKVGDESDCVTEADVNQVFRLGEYEYSFLYRDAGRDAFDASVASFGSWISELAQHLREAASIEPSSTKSPRYRHNVAHDGSIARLLSIVQLDRMVWPGMGAEVVFELYHNRKRRCDYVRMLWSGQVLRSSHPAMGEMEMIPLGTLLTYIDGLVGLNGSRVPELCGL